MSKSYPIISIIIPSFNHLEQLQDCVSSIKKQTFKDYEVWILDNNSSDGTKKYLKTLQTPFHTVSEKDHGVYEAMNKGISLATGAWLFFMGANDFFYSESVLEEIFTKPIDRKYNLIAGKILYLSDKSQFIYSKNKNEKKPSWSFSIWIRNSLHHQGTFYRKELFAKNRYNIKYKVLADYALNLFFFNSKDKCKIEDKFITKCSGNGLSKTRKWLIYTEEISLKMDQSSKLFLPFFFIIAASKYILGKTTRNK